MQVFFTFVFSSNGAENTVRILTAVFPKGRNDICAPGSGPRRSERQRPSHHSSSYSSPGTMKLSSFFRPYVRRSNATAQSPPVTKVARAIGPPVRSDGTVTDASRSSIRSRYQSIAGPTWSSASHTPSGQRGVQLRRRRARDRRATSLCLDVPT